MRRKSRPPADDRSVRQAPEGSPIEDRLLSLEAHRDHLHQLERDVIAHLTALSEQVERLGAQTSGMTARQDEVEAHLRARPYVSAPEVLSQQAPDGREVIGFVSDAGPGATPGDYADFEDLFRGTAEQIRAKQRGYVELARGHGPVLDLGCGRGEFLELLAAEGIAASGVDLDASMVERAREAGVDARVGDAFDVLAECADGSLGMVFSAQVIEHLAPADMQRFVDETHRVVRDDGLVVIETVNVHSVRAMRFFWIDRTHTIPVYPETALMMARSAGFASAVVVFPDSTGTLAEDLAWCGDFAVVCAKDSSVLVDAGLLAADA